MSVILKLVHYVSLSLIFDTSIKLVNDLVQYLSTYMCARGASFLLQHKQ